MGNIAAVPIRDFLEARVDKFDPSSKELRSFRRLDKIDFTGTIHLSDKISKTDMIIVHPGDLVISGINVAKGAVAVHDGTEPISATIHYSTYKSDPAEVEIEYFRRYLKSDEFIDALKEQVRGGIKTEIKAKTFLSILVPLPNIKEQRRIVSVLKRSELELVELSGEIENQETLIKAFRQSILQEAIEGRLTADWRKKHPFRAGDPERDGAALLEKIREEKKRLVAEGKIRKEKPTAPVAAGEEPFELPVGWVWCRLGQLSLLITSGSRNWKDHYSKQGSPLIRSQDIKHDYLEFDDQVYVELSGKVEGDRTKVCLLDLLLTITGGNVGKCALLNIELETAFVSQHVALIRLIRPSFASFIHKWLTSSMGGRGLLLGASYGDKPGLNLMQLNDLLIPLPPLAEQAAIVERVEALLAHVGEMEKEVAARKGHTEELMREVLREAFE
jgi:type I restriction enzyme S subunit